MRIAIFGSMDVPPQEGLEVLHYDIHNYTLDGQYDQIIVANALPELHRNKVIPFLENAYNALVNRGELILYVPSAEWAAKQIFTNTADNITYYMLYGEEAKPFRACYTMLALRTLVERVPFVVRSASENILKISTPEGETVKMPVHAITAVRND
ncbi:MAG: hypothetical protein BWY95_01493 [Bacteroidetes bacterium ADurb.BinA104]|nr:MAG: hypothetical protein BWY95_01493 [Bacteroidetes bacterium ADurb.BinA104]